MADSESTDHPYKDGQVAAPRRLRRVLALTLLGLWAERLVRAFWPAWSAALALGAAWRLGLFAALDPAVAGPLWWGGVAVIAGLAAHGLARFRPPRRTEAERRLDASLPERPLAALADHPAIGAEDPAARALWQAHLRRMTARLACARPVPPDLRLSDRDPLALRYLALTAAVVAALFGTATPGGLPPLLPGAAPAAAPAGLSWEGWIEPPRYTGRPGIYLNAVAPGEALEVPAGSRVTLRLYGAPIGKALRQSVADDLTTPPPPDADTAEQAPAEARFTVVRSGEIALAPPSGPAIRWPVRMLPDRPPEIALSGPVERTAAGAMVLPFRARDDYGVARAQATIRLDLAAVDRRHGLELPPEPRAPITLDLPMPFSGDRRDFADSLTEDLSAHPWAGLPVTVTLTATDEAGQSAASAPVPVTLPGRRFAVALAGAIAEQRRDLLWNRGNAGRVAMVLRAVSYRPEEVFEDNARAYLVLRAAIRRLEAATANGARLGDDRRDEIAAMLWHAALLIEEGDLSDALARLRRAQERLSQALRDGASQREIAELTEELRRAMQDYMRQLAENADGQQQQAENGRTIEITPDQLQALLDRIQELSRQGRNAEAQALLQQLQRLMENLQTARRGPGAEGEGQQALRGLQDTLRQQQRLSDDAFRRLQRGFNDENAPGAAPRPGEGAGPDDPDSPPGPQDLARRQQALRDLLERQRRGLPADGSEDGRKARRALRRAEGAMERAEEKLRRGDLSGALDDQAEALQALREGMRELGRQIARQQNPDSGRQGEQAGAADRNGRADPLGRRAGSDGRLGAEDGFVPGTDPFRRAQELRDEILRRSGERDRPRIERDYLKRLLDRF